MLDRECSTERLLLLASSPQVFVIGLAAERAVELARVSTAYRNSDDLSRNFIVMMFDVQLEDHMAKHASSSNFLTEEPICRTFPITRRQHVQHKSHGFDDVFEKSPQYYPAKQIVPPNSSKSELNRATWHRHERASSSTRATLHRSAVYALPTCLDINIGFITLSRCMISILL
jgi:hypothetical protein